MEPDSAIDIGDAPVDDATSSSLDDVAAPNPDEVSATATASLLSQVQDDADVEMIGAGSAEEVLAS